MPHTPRCQQWTDEAFNHVFSRDHNRETVFADANDSRFFLILLDRYRQCSHLLLHVPQPATLSRLMTGLGLITGSTTAEATGWSATPSKAASATLAWRRLPTVEVLPRHRFSQGPACRSSGLGVHHTRRGGAVLWLQG